MINSIITSYDRAVQSKRDELITYANSHLDSIAFPPKEVSQPVPASKSPNTGIAVACMAGGVAVLALGLLISKTAISVIGGVVAAGGLLLKGKSASASVPVKIETDYFALSQNTYQTIRNINRHISEEWDRFLGTQIEKLKSDIQAMDVNDKTKSQMMAEAVSRSVFISPASDSLTKLTGFGNQKNLPAYKQYVAELKVKYAAALSNAYNEQRAIYDKVIAACI